MANTLRPYLECIRSTLTAASLLCCLCAYYSVALPTWTALSGTTDELVISRTAAQTRIVQRRSGQWKI